MLLKPYYLIFGFCFSFVFISCIKNEEEELTTEDDSVQVETLGYSSGLRDGIPPDYFNLQLRYESDTLPPSAQNYYLDMPPAQNQGAIGSCTAWAVAYAVKGSYRKLACGMNWLNSQSQLNLNLLMSPSYVFNLTLNKYGGDCKKGVYLSNTISTIQEFGCCTMNEMNYTTDCNELPGNNLIKAGKRNLVGEAGRIDVKNINGMKHALLDGYPVVIAAHLNNGFKNCSALPSGEYIWNDHGAPLPDGYHALTIYGYNESLNAFKALNSWGNWKNDGSIYIDYSMFDGSFIDQAYVISDSLNSCTLTTPSSPVTDADGNIYNTIQVGSTIWMTTNLNTTLFQNGDNINLVNPYISTVVPSAYFVNNDSTLPEHYGKMYNWYAVDDPRNICPSGMHIPTDDEWSYLRSFVNSEGLPMMYPTTDWGFNNGFPAGINLIGFSAYPAGKLDYSTSTNFGFSANFWTSSYESGSRGWFYWVGQYPGLPIFVTARYYDYKFDGMSCRCVDSQ